MDYIHIDTAVRSFVWKTNFHTHPDVIPVVSSISSTPRADAIFLFISDILWLSGSFLSLSSDRLTTGIDISFGGVVCVCFLFPPKKKKNFDLP